MIDLENVIKYFWIFIGEPLFSLNGCNILNAWELDAYEYIIKSDIGTGSRKSGTTSRVRGESKSSIVRLPPFTAGEQVEFTFITNKYIGRKDDKTYDVWKKSTPKYQIKVWSRNSNGEIEKVQTIEGQTILHSAGAFGINMKVASQNCSFNYIIPNVDGIAQIFLYGGESEGWGVGDGLGDDGTFSYSMIYPTCSDEEDKEEYLCASNVRIQLNRGILPEKKIIEKTMTSSSGEQSTTESTTDPRTFYIRNKVSPDKSNIQIKLGSDIKFDGLVLKFNEVNNINQDKTREALKNNIGLGRFNDAEGGDTGTFDVDNENKSVDVYYYYDEITDKGKRPVNETPVNDWTTIIVFDSEVTIDKILDYQVIDTDGNIFNSSNDPGNDVDVIKINLSGNITEVTPYYLKNLLKMKNVEVKDEETSSYDKLIEKKSSKAIVNVYKKNGQWINCHYENYYPVSWFNKYVENLQKLYIGDSINEIHSIDVNKYTSLYFIKEVGNPFYFIDCKHIENNSLEIKEEAIKSIYELLLRVKNFLVLIIYTLKLPTIFSSTLQSVVNDLTTCRDILNIQISEMEVMIITPLSLETNDEYKYSNYQKLLHEENKVIREIMTKTIFDDTYDKIFYNTFYRKPESIWYDSVKEKYISKPSDMFPSWYNNSSENDDYEEDMEDFYFTDTNYKQSVYIKNKNTSLTSNYLENTNDILLAKVFILPESKIATINGNFNELIVVLDRIIEHEKSNGTLESILKVAEVIDTILKIPSIGINDSDNSFLFYGKKSSVLDMLINTKERIIDAKITILDDYEKEIVSGIEAINTTTTTTTTKTTTVVTKNFLKNIEGSNYARYKNRFKSMIMS